jgi:hypothetical protein
MDDKKELAALEQDVRRPSDNLAGPGEAPEGEPGRTAGEPKGMRRPKGLLDIHSSLSRGIHSVPARNGRCYLDLYLLQIERERLTQEAASLNKRNTRIQRRLTEIESEMAEKQEKAAQGESSEMPARNGKPRQRSYEYKREEWNRMSVNY